MYGVISYPIESYKGNYKVNWFGRAVTCWRAGTNHEIIVSVVFNTVTKTASSHNRANCHESSWQREMRWGFIRCIYKNNKLVPFALSELKTEIWYGKMYLHYMIIITCNRGLLPTLAENVSHCYIVFGSTNARLLRWGTLVLPVRIAEADFVHTWLKNYIHVGFWTQTVEITYLHSLEISPRHQVRS